MFNIRYWNLNHYSAEKLITPEKLSSDLCIRSDAPLIPVPIDIALFTMRLYPIDLYANKLIFCIIYVVLVSTVHK